MPYAEVNGARIHYFDVGHGEPAIVLLHAFPLQAEMWAPQLACLSATRRVIAPDLAGFGASDPPDEPGLRTVGHYVEDVRGLLASLNVTRAVLVGLSMGGYVAFSFLRLHPDLVVALVLADTRASADTPEVAARRSAQQDQIAAEGTSALRETLVQGLLGEHTLATRPALVEQVRRLTDNAPAAFLAALEAMKGRPDHTGDLASIAVPTLAFVGAQDRLSPPDVVRSWQEAIPSSRLAVLPRAGHLSNLEAPEEFNAALVGFLDDLGM